MSTTFCLKSKKSPSYFQKIMNRKKDLMTINELLSVSKEKIIQFSFDEIADDFDVDGFYKKTLKDFECLLLGVDEKSGRGFEISYNGKEDAFDIRLFCPCTPTDWDIALGYMRDFSLYLGSDIIGEDGDVYTTHTIQQYPYIENINYGIDRILENGTEYSDYTIYGVNRPFVFSTEMLSTLKNSKDRPAALEEMLLRVQYLDAFNANQMFFRETETGKIKGIYTISQNLETILPFEPCVEFDNMGVVNQEDVKSWEISIVVQSEGGLSEDDFTVLGYLNYDDFIEKLPKNSYHFIDGRYIVVKPLDQNQLMSILNTPDYIPYAQRNLLDLDVVDTNIAIKNAPMIVKIAKNKGIEALSYDEKMAYARALNNSDKEGKAIEVLESVEAEGQNDAKWAYRLAYAYFFRDEDEKAKELLKKYVDLARRQNYYHLISLLTYILSYMNTDKELFFELHDELKAQNPELLDEYGILEFTREKWDSIANSKNNENYTNDEEDYDGDEVECDFLSDNLVMLTLTLNSKLMPIDRGDYYEDPIDQLLTDTKIGYVDGGGTLLNADKSIKEIDIGITTDVENLDKVVEVIKNYPMPKGSSLYNNSTEKVICQVGNLEGIAVIISQELADEVYENNDINELVDLLVKKGEETNSYEMQGYSEIGTTKLFFYGKSYAEMKMHIQPVLAEHPLGEKAELRQIS